MDSVILWLFAAFSFVPFILDRPNKRTAQRLLTVVRVEIAIALLAPVVGLFADYLWLYVLIGLLWAFNASMAYRAMLVHEHAEAVMKGVTDANRTNSS